MTKAKSKTKAKAKTVAQRIDDLERRLERQSETITTLGNLIEAVEDKAQAGALDLESKEMLGKRLANVENWIGKANGLTDVLSKVDGLAARGDAWRMRALDAERKLKTIQAAMVVE